MIEFVFTQILWMTLWFGVVLLGLLFLRIMTGGWGDIQTDIHMSNLKREKEKEKEDGE